MIIGGVVELLLGVAADRRLRHKNTLPTATGPDLRLPIARERRISRM
jgi:hypothetical protein